MSLNITNACEIVDPFKRHNTFKSSKNVLLKKQIYATAIFPGAFKNNPHKKISIIVLVMSKNVSGKNQSNVISLCVSLYVNDEKIDTVSAICSKLCILSRYQKYMINL